MFLGPSMAPAIARAPLANNFKHRSIAVEVVATCTVCLKATFTLEVEGDRERPGFQSERENLRTGARKRALGEAR
jgi:hypothetical protein